MKSALKLLSLMLSVWVACPCTIYADSPPEEAVEGEKTQAFRNTMFALAERQLKVDEVNEALDTLTRLVEYFPEDAHIHNKLGYVHLKRKSYKASEKAFEKAKKFDRNLVEAYVGLGLVYTESPIRGIQAYYNFRKAVGEAKRATKIDPDYGPAYRLLGEAYEKFQEDHKRSLHYYEKYISLEPDNPEGLYYFGLACVQAQEFEKTNKYIAPYLQNNKDITQLLPLVAQGHFYSERYGKAMQFFERYLQNIEGSERQHYTEIAYIASDLELEEYNVTVGPERQAYLEQFWARRDPDILTKINERVIEHYRRVWYARTFFSLNVYPWDKRGQVYIRFGEPEYRSRSNDRRFVQSAEVETVRTRMAIDIYGPEAAFLTFTGPVFPVRTSRSSGAFFEREDFGSLSDQLAASAAISTDDNTEDIGSDFDPGLSELEATQGGLAEDFAVPFARDPSAGDGTSGSILDQTGKLNTRLQFGDYAPVTIDNEIDTVPWETWTYTQINGGIEITFTDELGNGRYAFAPVPEATHENPEAINYISRITEHTPEVVVQNTVARTPDFYRPGLPGDVLSFYYDLADFRGPDGQTTLEVYYGIPPEQVEVEQAADSTFIHVQVALALADEGHTAVYRTAQELLFQGNQGVQEVKGAFVPELLRTQVPPGQYELQVQLKDLISGRVGLYRQGLEIKDYRPGELQVSDIQLALTIGESGKNAKFQKDDVWIIPMPTRNDGESQNAYAYFEIYNLQKDAFGQTRYKVQYLIRSSSMPAVGALGAAASALRSLLKTSKPRVSITYEQLGRDEFEKEYVEIDLAKAKPGINALEVNITDLVSGKNVDREVRFSYGQ